MHQISLRLMVALLTFSVGVTCAMSFRAITSYQANLIHAREVILRDDLYQMRKLIDQYAADKGVLPQSLNDLVDYGYLRDIPEDPFTGRRDWIVVLDDDPASSEGAKGVVDIRSTSSRRSLDGTPYQKW